MDKSDYIFGLRPVIEAIEAGKEIDKLLLATDLQGELAHELIDKARRAGVLVKRVPAERINRITRKNHQGALALLSAVTYHRLDHLLPELYEAGLLPFLMALDGLTDVRNFGAIARTCECAGADGLIIPMHGSVSAGGDAMKTSAGALNHLPVCRERSLAGALRYIKQNGVQIVGVTEKATLNYTEADFTTPVCLVMGAEDTGLEPEVMEVCDTLVALPMFGRIGSLNVSVAAGVAAYEVVRQRLAANLEVI